LERVYHRLTIIVVASFINVSVITEPFERKACRKEKEISLWGKKPNFLEERIWLGACLSQTYYYSSSFLYKCFGDYRGWEAMKMS